MNKKSIYLPFFITALLLPYIGFLIGFWFYQYGLSILAPILIISVITAVFSCFAVDNALYHMLISLNQIAVFIIVCFLFSPGSDRLPAENMVVDPMSSKISALVVIVGVLFVISVFVIAYLYKIISKKLMNYDERVGEAEKENIGTKPSLKVISVIAFIMIIFSVFTVFASFILLFKVLDFKDASSYKYLSLMINLFVSAVLLFFTAMITLRIVSSKDGVPIETALNARAFGYTFLFTPLSAAIVLFLIVFIINVPVMFLF